MGRLFNFVLVGTLTLGVVFLMGGPAAHAGEGSPVEVAHGPNFVDEDGDGYNDNAPDHDGDGIPNGHDSDYVKPGTGPGPRRFIDEDGDGINDLAGGRPHYVRKNSFWHRMAERFGFFRHDRGRSRPEGRGSSERSRNRDRDCLSSGECSHEGIGHQFGEAKGGDGSRAAPDVGNSGRGERGRSSKR